MSKTVPVIEDPIFLTNVGIHTVQDCAVRGYREINLDDFLRSDSFYGGITDLEEYRRNVETNATALVLKAKEEKWGIVDGEFYWVPLDGLSRFLENHLNRKYELDYDFIWLAREVRHYCKVHLKMRKRETEKMEQILYDLGERVQDRKRKYMQIQDEMDEEREKKRGRHDDLRDVYEKKK